MQLTLGNTVDVLQCISAGLEGCKRFEGNDRAKESKVKHCLLNLGQEGSNILNLPAPKHSIARSMFKEHKQHLKK